MIFVIGGGGNGQSYFMDFLIKNNISINEFRDRDDLKHVHSLNHMNKVLQEPHNKNKKVKKIIFLYNHPYYAVKSHYRRKWHFSQMKKLGNPCNFKNRQEATFENFSKITLKHNRDFFGLEYQFNNWINAETNIPILFLDFNEINNKKERLNKFLNKKLDYSSFVVKERNSKHNEESPLFPIYEKLYQTMKNKINNSMRKNIKK